MERRDFFIDDIEKISVIIARLLGFKGQKKTDDQQQEIDNGLSELFDLELDKMPFEELEAKVKAMTNPQRLDYLVQLLELEMENEQLTEEQLALRNRLLKITREEMEAKYAAQKTTTFFRQVNSST